MQDTKLNLKLHIALLTIILLWSSSFVGIRVALHDFGPGSMALLRYLVASITMAVFYLILSKRVRPTLTEVILMLLIGSIGIGIYNLCLNYGEVTVTAGVSSFIISLIPPATILLAFFMRQGSLSRTEWLGLTISVAGLLVMGGSEMVHTDVNWGLLLVFISTLSGALYTVMQKPFLKRFQPIEVTAFVIWGGTLCFLGYLPELKHDLATAHPVETLWVIYLGIFPAAIAYAAWSYVVSKMDTSKAANYLYSLPLVSTLLGIIILNEIPYWTSFLGGCIALGGAVISQYQSK